MAIVRIGLRMSEDIAAEKRCLEAYESIPLRRRQDWLRRVITAGMQIVPLPTDDVVQIAPAPVRLQAANHMVAPAAPVASPVVASPAQGAAKADPAASRSTKKLSNFFGDKAEL